VRTLRSDAFDVVRTIGVRLPDVEAASRYDGSPVLRVAGVFMAGLATHPSAEPDTLVVRADFDGRDRFIEDAPASALGRIDIVKTCFNSDGTLSGATEDQKREAFFWACGYGQDTVVELLLAHGAELTAQDSDGQTGLHCAAIGGHPSTVKLLVDRKAPLELQNNYGGTVLGQALWSAGHGGEPERYEEIIETLLAAAAHLPDRHVPVNDRFDALLLRYGSRPEPTWAWYGERPRQS
jgi:hypothetical protein